MLTKQIVYDTDNEMSPRDIDQLIASIADLNRMVGRALEALDTLKTEAPRMREGIERAQAAAEAAAASVAQANARIDDHEDRITGVEPVAREYRKLRTRTKIVIGTLGAGCALLAAAITFAHAVLGMIRDWLALHGGHH
jgi:septal ring factor EnvC (AmiA/AmiB activator)